MVSMDHLVGTLERLIAEGEELRPQGSSRWEGYNGKAQPHYVAWRLQCLEALASAGDSAKPALAEIERDAASPYFYEASVGHILGALLGVHAIVKNAKANVSNSKPKIGTQLNSASNSVFLVHGHDETLLHQVARFLERLRLKPVILFEKPGQGKTIIEKLEHFGDVTFAVVLLMPDDIGKLASADGEGKPRARQNVVLELGYFLGRLGRENVAALFDGSVELPSDYRGVEYIAVDAVGAWKLKLASELKAAGLSVDLNNAV
jgi:predicted nucleotide-binding protein